MKLIIRNKVRFRNITRVQFTIRAAVFICVLFISFSATGQSFASYYSNAIKTFQDRDEKELTCADSGVFLIERLLVKESWITKELLCLDSLWNAYQYKNRQEQAILLYCVAMAYNEHDQDVCDSLLNLAYLQFIEEEIGDKRKEIIKQ
jgi:hypothetical protein